MDSSLKKKLRALSLALRHEVRDDEPVHGICGVQERRELFVVLIVIDYNVRDECSLEILPCRGGPVRLCAHAFWPVRVPRNELAIILPDDDDAALVRPIVSQKVGDPREN